MQGMVMLCMRIMWMDVCMCSSFVFYNIPLCLKMRGSTIIVVHIISSDERGMSVGFLATHSMLWMTMWMTMWMRMCGWVLCIITLCLKMRCSAIVIVHIIGSNEGGMSVGVESLASRLHFMHLPLGILMHFTCCHIRHRNFGILPLSFPII